MEEANDSPVAAPRHDTGTAVQARGLSVSYGRSRVLHEVDLDVPSGSVVALLGPSGCGKTTLLRTIAGLEPATSGEIHIGGQLVTGPRTAVPPERRRVGMVFQDWALFPHLSVGRNVGFGLPRAERRGPRVDRALEMVGLAGFGERMPATLSGGQQQRVALARALAPEPGVLLLDEPFSNLDTALRARVRSEVHELLDRVGITTVFVTHDQDEAFVLGDVVAVMAEGRIVQQAAPHELYHSPATSWVARFVGDANLIAGRAHDARADTSLGPVSLRDRRTGAVEVLLRPEDLRLGSGIGSAGDSAPAIAARIELVEYYGHDTVYVAALDDGTRVKVREVTTPRFDRGDTTTVTVVAEAAVSFPLP